MIEVFRNITEAPSKGLQKIISKYADERPSLWDQNAPRWNGDYFGFSKSSLFQSLELDTKNRILKGCENDILNEIQLIEIAGMTYASRMSILASNDEERQLYCHFASDEARHYHDISTVVGRTPNRVPPAGSFPWYIGHLIETQERLPLLFVIQVVLEGWGIHYYSQLATHTLDPQLKRVLEHIVKDEAGHHGSGLLLFNEHDLSPESIEQTLGVLREFISSIKQGPLFLLKNLTAVVGPITTLQIAQFLEELSFEEKITNDLKIFKSLIRKSGSIQMLGRLEQAGAFDFKSHREQAAQEMLSLLPS